MGNQKRLRRPEPPVKPNAKVAEPAGRSAKTSDLMAKAIAAADADAAEKLSGMFKP